MKNFVLQRERDVSQYNFLTGMVYLFQLFFFFWVKKKSIVYRVSVGRLVQLRITNCLLEQFVSEPILN